MPLIGGGVAVSQVRGFRMSWFPGRVGAGKSALAYRLAYELAMSYDYRIISNQETVWNEPVEPDWIFDDKGNMTLRAVAIIDEGGLYVQDEEEAMEWLAFMGKMDIIALLPSFTEPCDLFSSLIIQPVYNLRSIGVPLNVYQWHVQQKKSKFSGQFYWLGMEEIYGVYSTLNPSSDPRGITFFIRKKVAEYKKYYMEKQRIPSWQEGYAVQALADAELKKRSSRRGSAMGEVRETQLLSSDISQAAKKFERVSEDLETVLARAPKGNGRRRGWFS